MKGKFNDQKIHWPESLWNNIAKPHNSHKQGCHWVNIIPLLILYLNLSHLYSQSLGTTAITLSLASTLTLSSATRQMKPRTTQVNTTQLTETISISPARSRLQTSNDDGRATFATGKTKLTINSCSGCCRGEDIIVTRCVLIGLSPGGDTWHLAVSV